MGKFAAIKERIDSARKLRKCRACGAKVRREEMRQVTLRVRKRYPQPILILRNLGGIILGHKPEEKGFLRYLFGHGFMERYSRKVKRRLCFDCFVQVLTPKEYELFREAYYEDVRIEKGEERATELIANMDQVFATREESVQ